VRTILIILTVIVISCAIMAGILICQREDKTQYTAQIVDFIYDSGNGFLSSTQYHVIVNFRNKKYPIRCTKEIYSSYKIGDYIPVNLRRCNHNEYDLCLLF